MDVHIFDGYEDAMEFSGADPTDFQPPAAGAGCLGAKLGPACTLRL